MSKYNFLFNTNIAVSEEEDQMKEVEETLNDNYIDEELKEDMDNNLEISRMERDADPKKKTNSWKKRNGSTQNVGKRNKSKNKTVGRRKKDGKKQKRIAKKQRKSVKKQRNGAKNKRVKR